MACTVAEGGRLGSKQQGQGGLEDTYTESRGEGGAWAGA